MSTWRLAKSLDVLRGQVNVTFPNRSKDSDGTIGDMSHSERKSDHNPVNGIVHALDITHDPAHGFDSYAFADLLLKAQDSRMSYVISNRRIGSGPSGLSPGVWRKYTGTNPHDHHCHISVVGNFHADDAQAWDLSGYKLDDAPDHAVDPVFIPAPPTLRAGSTGANVEKLQRALACDITAHFYAGSETDYALRLFQIRYKVPGGADGVCGPQTWKALGITA